MAREWGGGRRMENQLRIPQITITFPDLPGSSVKCIIYSGPFNNYRTDLKMTSDLSTEYSVLCVKGQQSMSQC